MKLLKKLFKGLMMSISMFSNIPVKSYQWSDDAAGYIMLFLPVVGFIMAVLTAGVYTLLSLFNGGAIINGILILCFYYVLTGFLHLDGFMDTCDAILSRRDLEERLRILKDSHAGAFSVISVVLLVLINCGALMTVLDRDIPIWTLCFALILSRSFAGVFTLTLKPLKSSSLGTFFKDITPVWIKFALWVLILCVLLLGVLFCGIAGGLALLCAGAGACISALIVYKNLDGFSGDLSGFSIQICETVCVVVLALL